MELLFENIEIGYTGLKKPILDIKELKFKNGLNFVIGGNGTGKSTLLKAISNFNDEIKLKGIIKLNGIDISNESIGLVSQNPINSINTELTFIENIILAKTEGFEHLSLKPQSTLTKQNIIKNHLSNFKNWDYLKNLIDKEAGSLSSGQQQILSILMRVIKNHSILLLDECTANLDNVNVGIVMDLINEISNNDTIVIFVTHQLDLINKQNSKTYLVENGTIKEK